MSSGDSRSGGHTWLCQDYGKGSSSWRCDFSQLDSTYWTLILTNSLQLIFSFLYLLYNATYTSMLQDAEWAEYTTRRKPLRVTTPREKQRSTYYLQLPYRYALPLMGASAVMHWFISQSIFLAMIKRRTVPYDNGDPMDNTSVTCGCSIIPIIFSISLGGIMLLTLIIPTVFRRLPAGVPLLGNCSAVISAACHLPKEDDNAAVLPIQWGAVGDADGRAIGHCALTSMEVTRSIKGRLYAGKY